MPRAPLPADEKARLSALHSYNVLDTVSEAVFDELVELAADLTESPIALVSLVDAERQWFKARRGLSVEETHRDFAFCAHAILTPDDVLSVRDATQDLRFADNPLVIGAPDIRAYIGVPLVDSNGHALGTLCAIDRVPRVHELRAVRAMKILAKAVVANLELRRALHASAQQASTDALTGLANRRAITDAIASVEASDGPVAVLAIDLDHFKETNDVAGHAAGDALLRATGKRLKGLLRSSDVVGRVGGDEFIALMRGIADEDHLLQVAERIRNALHKPVPHNGSYLRLGATLGAALVPHDAETLEEGIHIADEALIRAKQKERGSIGRATPHDAARANREAMIIRSLQNLHDGKLPGLTSHLQPIVDLANNSIAAVEALARWTCPEIGPVSPDEFFPIATRAGLAVQLCDAARSHALASYVELRREGLKMGRLALNLSAAELSQEGVVQRLESQCIDVGLDLDAVTIEITEDALLERVGSATIRRLAALRGGGARLSLDDFGTGTSGLAQLMRLPLDEIKLDRSFTAHLGLDGRAERIVEGTIRLAESMGMRVVAEGIENQAQARQLREFGCDMGQGWLYARAMSVPRFREWWTLRHGASGKVTSIRRATAGGRSRIPPK